jgi:hypothetical protein
VADGVWLVAASGGGVCAGLDRCRLVGSSCRVGDVHSAFGRRTLCRVRDDGRRAAGGDQRNRVDGTGQVGGAGDFLPIWPSFA